jgi:hypothetical protein
LRKTRVRFPSSLKAQHTGIDHARVTHHNQPDSNKHTQSDEVECKNVQHESDRTAHDQSDPIENGVELYKVGAVGSCSQDSKDVSGSEDGVDDREEVSEYEFGEDCDNEDAIGDLEEV